jgi:hypothetical protein
MEMLAEHQVLVLFVLQLAVLAMFIVVGLLTLGLGELALAEITILLVELVELVHPLAQAVAEALLVLGVMVLKVELHFQLALVAEQVLVAMAVMDLIVLAEVAVLVDLVVRFLQVQIFLHQVDQMFLERLLLEKLP